jgi:predicted nucleic acid-binding protein
LFISEYFRAILKDQRKGQIPEQRLNDLYKYLKEYFEVEELSQELLKKAADLDPK